MQKSMMRQNRGSAMVGAIIISIVVGVAMAATMHSSFNEYKMSKRYLDSQHALNLAESGLEEAVRAYNAGDWTGWTSEAGGYYKVENPTWLENGLTGEIRIFAKNSAGSPSIAAQGKVTDGNGSSISRQILVNMSASSMFANGLLAETTITFNGNGVTVDSYDSTLGAKTSTWGVNRFSNGNIASNSVEVEDVSIQNGDVYGYVAIGASTYDPDDLVGSNGRIQEYGDTGAKVDPERVTGDFKATLPATPTPGFESYADLDTFTPGTPGGAMAYYQADSLNIKNKEVLKVEGPVTLYVDGDVTIKGLLEVAENAELHLYVAGNMDVGGTGIANKNASPERLMIYGMATTPGGQLIKIAGSGAATAVIYAPKAIVEIKGGGHAEGTSGAIVGYSIKMTGHQRFSYDENLKNLGGGGGLKINYWRELKTAAERLPFDSASAVAAKI